MGNFVDEKDLDFCLWSPLDKLFHQLGLKKVPFTTEPFHLRGYKGGPQKIIFGPSEGWRGVSDSFSVHVPEKIESQFWEGVLLEVEKFAPISLAVELPDKSALQAGFVRSAIMPPPQIAAAGVPTIHLMGHSMAAEVVADLKPLGGGGKFSVLYTPLNKTPWEMSGLKIPTQRHKDDMVIIMALGNLLFKKDGHFSDGGKCHLEGPSYLDDQGASILLGGFSGLIREVSRKFKGKIVVAGPFPRHLADCCNLAEHKIPRSSVFKHPLHYYDMWNRFLSLNPSSG